MRTVRGILCAVALLWLSSCATSVGVLVGPVAYPVSEIDSTVGQNFWQKALTAPFAVVVGPVVGLVTGFRADCGYVTTGGYGLDGNPEFGDVFDPVGDPAFAPDGVAD